jgi:hypothetical protein
LFLKPATFGSGVIGAVGVIGGIGGIGAVGVVGVVGGVAVIGGIEGIGTSLGTVIGTTGKGGKTPPVEVVIGAVVIFTAGVF